MADSSLICYRAYHIRRSFAEILTIQECLYLQFLQERFGLENGKLHQSVVFQISRNIRENGEILVLENTQITYFLRLGTVPTYGPSIKKANKGAGEMATWLKILRESFFFWLLTRNSLGHLQFLDYEVMRMLFLPW